MAQYRVQFSNGSTDIVDADTAAEAREKASEEFGRVKTVEIIEDEYEDEDDLEDDEEAEDEDEDENGDDEEDEDDNEDAPARKRK